MGMQTSYLHNTIFKKNLSSKSQEVNLRSFPVSSAFEIKNDDYNGN